MEQHKILYVDVETHKKAKILAAKKGLTIFNLTKELIEKAFEDL